MTLPVGKPVEEVDAPVAPSATLRGSSVSLAWVDPDADVDELYEGSHGSVDVESVWTYMGYGPFSDRDAMRAWLHDCQASSDPLFLTVKQNETGKRIGMVSFLHIVPKMRTLELGHIWYAPEAQRTATNTETVYLMLCEAFDRMKCRRVEWKCDSLNARSRAAALRLGFQFEGIFRQHLIVKGRNRDTAWFAMLDADWPRIRENMKRWLATDPSERPSLARLNESL